MNAVLTTMSHLKAVPFAMLVMIAGTSIAQIAPPPPPPQPAVLATHARPASHSLLADAPQHFEFGQYLQLVRTNNLSIAAQKAQVDISDAQIALAALFPDPVFTTGLGAYEMSRDKLPTFSTFGVNFTIEGGKKRQARTEAARADKARAQAEFERQIMAVQLDAANAYIDYLKAKELQAYRQTAAALLTRIAQRTHGLSRRSDVVSEVQLQTEVLRGQAELDAAEADVYIFSRAMLGFVQPTAEAITRRIDSKGSLSLTFLTESESLRPLLSREDVVLAEKALDSARKREELSRENRSMDLNFNIGVNHGRQGDYLGTYLPQSNSLMATVAIPIPFSLRQDGDLRAASAATTQAMAQYQDVSLRAALDAEQARARYGAAVSQMKKYQASAELSTKALNTHVELYLNNKSDLGDVILLYKLANESQALSMDSRANHAHSMATLLNQANQLQTMKF